MTCGELILTVSLLRAPSDPGQTQGLIPASSNSMSALKPLVPTSGVTWLKLRSQLTTVIGMLELRPEVTACHSHGLPPLHKGKCQTCMSKTCGKDSQSFQHLYDAIMKNRWDQAPSEINATHTTSESSLKNKYIQVLVCT